MAARETAKLPASKIEKQLEKINDFLRYETIVSNIRIKYSFFIKNSLASVKIWCIFILQKNSLFGLDFLFLFILVCYVSTKDL